MSEPAEVRVPTLAEIQRLPHWARVAFAARCARRLQPLFKAEWSKARPRAVATLERAITLSEQAAARGAAHAVDELDAAAVAARAVADATISADAAAYAARAAADAADAADVAANAARGAADAADAVDSAAYALATHDISRGARAADANAALAARLAHAASSVRHDFELLLAAARSLKWTDDTKVPPEFFGPMWPAGAPESWPEGERRPGSIQLVIEIDVPADATREEVLAKISECVLHANALHRAHGGKGLRVDDIEIDRESPVRVGAVP